MGLNMDDLAEPVIDVTRLLDRFLHDRLPTGVDRVNLEYIRHFGQGASALVRFGGRWLRLGESSSLTLFEALLCPGRRFHQTIRQHVGLGYAFGGRMRVHGRWFIHAGHSGLNDPGYAVHVQKLGLRPLYFLHDLIPITHPEYCRPGEAARHEARLHTMLTTAVGLVLNSQDTANALAAYASKKGLFLPPHVVAPLAPASLPAPQGERPLPAPYFVVLGTIEPRKNHLLLLHVWRQLSIELGDACPQLVIIGQRGWECEQVVDLLERCEAIHPFVLEVPGCSDAELSSWLAHAQALLFPSFVEGYGMPLVEALAHGTPVMASDLQVFKEIAGDIPDYLDPLDGPGWLKAITDYCNPSSARREAQLRRLAGWKAPTWEMHFEIVDAFMQGLDRARA